MKSLFIKMQAEWSMCTQIKDSIRNHADVEGKDMQRSRKHRMRTLRICTTIQITIGRMIMRCESNVCKVENKESGVLLDWRTFEAR